ncbi:RNase adapter RapZ [bacterium]|nr:RNase adapter RapZ [bacterium]
MQITIITGMSGAGKTQAMHYFEDAGHFCVDNLPPALLPKFAQLCMDTQGKISQLAVVIDIRGGEFFHSLFQTLDTLKQLSIPYRILFLEASDEVLVRRFSETRRKHPLSTGGRISDDIDFERKKMAAIRSDATFIIDTSCINSRELYEEIRKVLETEVASKRLTVIVVSFGFKYGIPLDSDLVFDVRFLPNPFYIPELKESNGLDERVYNNVINSAGGAEFARRLKEFIEYLIPQFIHEPKSRVQIAIGCTGGRHRSVAFAEFLFRELKGEQLVVLRQHRDLESG